ncbi:MAG: sodium-independent anion transporter [Gammaproteobacteria bacterium RIFCSPHIGHO2_12_FULL_41_20]|nr:MAG: sodium-independent anion transporter [Gammaproteobacteria bacterium RIFCSPHIGHO2_12_FULL_41_20]
MVALVEAYRSGLLKPQQWWSNIIAGLIVGIVALPLAMAFAIASGVRPEQGLYTAIIAGICVGLLGGTRVQIAGPTGAFVVILANITAQYGVSGLQVATLLAGVMLLLMGLVRLGSVIRFIPDPVIVGFTSGIGVIIFVGEWKDFLGLSVHLPLDAHFHQKLLILLSALSDINWATTGLACLSILLILITPKVWKRIPGPLVAMLVVTVLQAVFQFAHVATLGNTFGSIPRQLPGFHIPAMSLTQVLSLIGPAFTVALLGAIESLLSATVADNMTGTRHHANQELMGQGIANMLTPLFGGFAATGAIARTATNIRNGGNSPIAAIVHSLVLVAVIVLLAPLAAYIPLCALAAILFVVAYNMSDIPHFVRILKHAPRYDVAVLLVTFFLTIFTDLVVAVNVGVILSMLFFIRRMRQSVTVERQPVDILQTELTAYGVTNIPQDTIVYSIQGPFFFGVTEKIEYALTHMQTEYQTVIFRLKGVPFMDMTGLETFKKLIEQYHQRGIRIFLCEANATVIRKLTHVGVLRWIEAQRVFHQLSDVFTVSLPSASVTP